MSAELIPGMALRIRDTLKRRSGDDSQTADLIDNLTVDQIYAQAPSDAIRRCVQAAPIDRSDIRQWKTYRDVVETAIGAQEINEWIRNLQQVHGIPLKRRVA